MLFLWSVDPTDSRSRYYPPDPINNFFSDPVTFLHYGCLIIREVKSMNKELDEIYRLYAADVYRYIWGMCRNETLAADILQDTMLKAVTGFDKFRGESSVKTWLFGIAKNLYLNHVKRSDNNNLLLDEAVNQSGESLEERFGDTEQAMHIHRLLHRLEEPYKEVFSLRVFAELKFDDIGGIFGKSGNWARVTFFRAKEKILDLLKSEEE